MEIYLIRHGIAEDAQANQEDHERALTTEGQEKTAQIARNLRKRCNGIEAIFHSPYLRAQETAEIFHKEFANAELAELHFLQPHSPVIAAIPFFQECSKKYKSVALVGHEPYMSTLASLLITGKQSPVMAFKKAGIANIKWLGPEHSYLQYLLTPKMIL